MRDILGVVDSSSFHKVFGGKTVLLGGDFRQVFVANMASYAICSEFDFGDS
jgi:hypothetical protein